MSWLRVHTVLASFGLALGFTLGGTGFSDYGEIHSMWTFGLFGAGPSARTLRLDLVYGCAVAVAMAGFLLLARRDRLPARPVHRGSVAGGLLFGAGWALSGACPAVILVQLGEGRLSALWTIAGVLAGIRVGRRLKHRLGIRATSCGGAD